MPLSRGRARLSQVLRAAGQFITVAEAATALGVDQVTAAKLLARWQEQGWLKRVRRGLYAPVPLTATPADQIIEDSWTLVPRLFDPGYIGAATAAHYWGLTEQLFRTTFVYTARPTRRSEQVIHGIPFRVRHVRKKDIFGTRGLWRGRTKVQISDLHRTLIDILDDPSMGGGIRHVADCLRAYLRHGDASLETLVAYGDQLGNGAVFKRLGFLAERNRAPKELVAACAERLTQGTAKLDPGLPSPRLLRRWRLWVPDRWKREAPLDD